MERELKDWRLEVVEVDCDSGDQGPTKELLSGPEKRRQIWEKFRKNLIHFWTWVWIVWNDPVKM